MCKQNINLNFFCIQVVQFFIIIFLKNSQLTLLRNTFVTGIGQVIRRHFSQITFQLRFTWERIYYYSLASVSRAVQYQDWTNVESQILTQCCGWWSKCIIPYMNMTHIFPIPEKEKNTSHINFENFKWIIASKCI